MLSLLFVLLLFSSILIVFQDFKERKISLIVLLTFGFSISAIVFLNYGISVLLRNSISSLLYILFTWVILCLVFSIKSKKFDYIIDNQLGLGDIITMFFLGISFNIVGQIMFFATSYIFSLVVFAMITYQIKKDSLRLIPLAGLMVIFYILVICILNFTSLSNFIEFSIKYI